MNYTVIDYENWDRKELFELYTTSLKITMNLTVEIDVTNIVKTLTDPLIGNRRLATTFDPDPGAKFVMINKTNELIPHMKSYFGTGSDAVFLDTGDSNSMAIVALYECNSTTLL